MVPGDGEVVNSWKYITIFTAHFVFVTQTTDFRSRGGPAGHADVMSENPDYTFNLLFGSS